MVYKVDIREKCGKEIARKLRRQGLIPGIIYGHGEKNVPIVIDRKVLHEILVSGEEVFDVEFNGEKRIVLLKEIQRHPVTDEIIHFDLQFIHAGEKIRATVPIVLVGESKGVKAGGILEQLLHETEVECLPKDLPHKITVDISELDIGESIHLKDIDLGPNVRFTESLESTVVTIFAPKVEEKPTEEEVPPEEAKKEEEAPPEESESSESK